MNMLKFGYRIVLDGLPDIPEFHFFLGSGRPQTRFSSNVLLIFQKSLNVWKDICLEGSLYEPIKKEMCHLKAEKYKSFWMFTESDIVQLPNMDLASDLEICAA